MKTLIAAILAFTGVVAGSQSALAESQIATILFGKNYNDGVTAIGVPPGGSHKNDLSLSPFAIQPLPATMRTAQAKVSQDADLVAAIERRNIALHNVLWVETAANGGRIIYYR
ncbi:hypothetical protein M8R20_02565 [Pseudomonas sp. R2.Fl]|nr:hypothetical protein [Pseudomonas sp. R2.Fl]